VADSGATPTFSRADDGAVRLVGGWPPTAVFSLDLLAHAEGTLVRYEGDRIDLTVANAAATYRVTRRDRGADSVEAVLVWSRGPDAGGAGGSEHA
jgi:hypothetical protein